MKALVNFLCNIPLYVGLGILHLAVAVKFVANQFFDLSFYLHMKAGTEIGQKIKSLTEQAKKFAEALKAQAAEENKLARIVRPQALPGGVVQIGKKSTSDN